jgi:Mn2+/Fe2+ NRAMP family transporter
MKKALEITLAIATSIGGFLEVGAIATAAEAGAGYGYQLLWAIVLGTVCLIFLVEMAGRFAAVSHHTIPDAMRERFGFTFFLVPLGATLFINLLVLAAEIGGVSLALQFATGIGYRWWAVLVAFATWLLLWKGTFGLIEKGTSLLGLVTLCFVAGAWTLEPSCFEVAAGAIPSLPAHDKAHYWFVAVSIIGAVISPYLYFFYSAGAIEDEWDASYLTANRVIAILGMSFGALVAVAVLVVSALVLRPRGIEQIASYDTIAMVLTPSFGFWGFVLVTASIGICCFGAALQIGLSQAYFIAQGFGWNWGENLPPKSDPGFSLSYTLSVFLAALPIAAGVDPLKLTNFSMALTAVTLPLGVIPFLFLMNDRKYLGEARNGWFGNAAVAGIIGLGFILAVVTIPLQIVGS